MNRHHGFTIIELSIVLVIIGLILGGIMVGRDLIAAAYIRATVAQIEKYNTAVYTFRGKYNGLPGDLLYTSASQLGMSARAGDVGHGNGDYILEAGMASAVGTATAPRGETVLFWNDLSTANLVDGLFTGDDSAGGIKMASVEDDGFGLISDAWALGFPTYDKNTIQPTAKIKNGNYVIVYADSGVNYFELAGLTSANGSAYTLYNALTPIEAFNMDNKLDDGNPMAGRVRATEGTGPDNLATPGVAACVSNATTQYNDTLVTPLCHLRIRMN